MVLLKNDNQTLPIKPGMKVAVMGATVPYKVTDGAPGSGNMRVIDWATQDQHEIRTGDLGSSRVFPDPDKSIRPFDGIKETAPNPDDVFNPKTVADAASADFIVVIAGLTPRTRARSTRAPAIAPASTSMPSRSIPSTRASRTS